MTNTKDAGKKVFELLAFQYEPLEKQMLKTFPELKEQYESMDYTKKIKALDMFASDVLGL